MSNYEPPEVVCWAAIICRGCGRRLYDDDGNKIKPSFWQWLNGCL